MRDGELCSPYREHWFGKEKEEDEEGEDEEEYDLELQDLPSLRRRRMSCTRC